MIRFYILRALLRKELQRHVSNRGGIALGLLLVVAAILLSVFNPAGFAKGGSTSNDADGTDVVGGVHRCFIYYSREDTELLRPILDHLESHIPASLLQHVYIRDLSPERIHEGVNFSPGVGSIRLSLRTRSEQQELHVEIFHPPGDTTAMAPYESWLWKELHSVFQEIARKRLHKLGVPEPAFPNSGPPDDDLWAVRQAFEQLQETAELQKPPALTQHQSSPVLPQVRITRQGLGGKILELRSAIATALVVFALYFSCVYLLPTLNCEERERGVLLAQALSPASPAEILLAKFLFYPVMGGALATVIAGIYKPDVLSTLFFWMTLATVAGGFLGIGMTIATLARTQRAAFMGAMCYLLSVSLVLIICSTNGIPFVSNLALEYHVPRVLHASLSGSVQNSHWLHLLAAMILACFWLMLAGQLFRHRGWQ